MSGDDEQRVLVGAVAGAFGVTGEVRLKSFCAEPEAIADYAPLYDAQGRSYGLKLTRAIPQGYAARLEGITNREAAEARRALQLYADRARLPSLPDDEFYHADLIGLQVVDVGGAPLGRVRAVLNHGAGDILEITRRGRGSLCCCPSPGLRFPPWILRPAGSSRIRLTRRRNNRRRHFPSFPSPQGQGPLPIR